MTLTAIKLNISTPTEPILPGRGFYQVEEDTLFVQIGSFDKYHRFFSFLESNKVEFDFDRRGRLIFIEIGVPRRQWAVDPFLKPPDRVEAADIRWLNFRETIKAPSISTDKTRSVLKLSLNGNKTELLNYYLAQSVMVQTDANGRVAAIWVTKISDDMAGREIAAYRKTLRADRPYFSSLDEEPKV